MATRFGALTVGGLGRGAGVGERVLAGLRDGGLGGAARPELGGVAKPEVDGCGRRLGERGVMGRRSVGVRSFVVAAGAWVVPRPQRRVRAGGRIIERALRRARAGERLCGTPEASCPGFNRSREGCDLVGCARGGPVRRLRVRAERLEERGLHRTDPWGRPTPRRRSGASPATPLPELDRSWRARS